MKIQRKIRLYYKLDNAEVTDGIYEDIDLSI